MENQDIVMKQIQDEISKIIDPEIGVPIVEMNLIDKLEIKDGIVEVEYHATTPYCPPMFAIYISKSIKENLSKINGVRDVKVRVTGHFLADAINRQVDNMFSTQKENPSDTKLVLDQQQYNQASPEEK